MALAACMDVIYLHFSFDIYFYVSFAFSVVFKFVLKTLRLYEFELLERLLPSYLAHLEGDNTYSLLPRFLAVCCLKVDGHAPIYLQVTNNVCYINRPLARVFDLKGSSWGRYVDEEDTADFDDHDNSNAISPGRAIGAATGGVAISSTARPHSASSSSSTSSAAGGALPFAPVPSCGLVLKEHNFSARGLVRERRGEYPFPEQASKLSVGAEMRDGFLRQLSRDLAWLTQHQLMDYSVVVGVVDDFSVREECGTLKGRKNIAWAFSFFFLVVCSMLLPCSYASFYILLLYLLIANASSVLRWPHARRVLLQAAPSMAGHGKTEAEALTRIRPSKPRPPPPPPLPY